MEDFCPGQNGVDVHLNVGKDSGVARDVVRVVRVAHHLAQENSKSAKAHFVRTPQR